MTTIGNQDRFAFECVPVRPSWEVRYDKEAGGWAGLAIWVGGQNLCQHLPHGSAEVEDYLFVPLGPLVDWLLRSFPALAFEERPANFNGTRDLFESADRWAATPPPSALSQDEWDDQRDEWWDRHFLRAGADGSRLPNMALVRDNEELAIDWAPPRFFRVDPPRLLNDVGSYSLPWIEAVTVIDEFTSRVAQWLRDDQATAAFPWTIGPERPLLGAEPTLSQAIELLTGRSIDSLHTLFHSSTDVELLAALRLSANDRDPASSPTCQILRDLPPGTTDAVATVAQDLASHASRTDDQLGSRWREARAIAGDAARSARSFVEAGQSAAHELRRTLNLDGQPIGDMTQTASELGMQVESTHVEGEWERMLVAVLDRGMAAATILSTPRTSTRWGFRFESARALGHALLDPIRSGALGAASGPFAQASRRRRSGAFAAELLLPERAMREASRGVLDGASDDSVFGRLMEQYGVGARTAAFQLWNRRWLSSPDVRDELIDRFAASDAAGQA